MFLFIEINNRYRTPETKGYYKEDIIFSNGTPCEGLKLTTVVAEIVMAEWDEKFREKMIENKREIEREQERERERKQERG